MSLQRPDRLPALVALQRGFHTREVEIRQGVRIEPEMQHASDVLMPAEKGRVAVELQQQHVIAMLDRRTLPTAAVARDLMNRRAEGTASAGLGAGRRPVILRSRFSIYLRGIEASARSSCAAMYLMT
jgi:hypothetical protein